MSFYRSLLAAVAAMGLAGAVFADDAATSAAAQAPAATDSAKLVQTADASSTTQAAAPAASDNSAAASDQPKVDINKATVKELMKVKGLTANKARAIVAYRKKHGDFKSTDDLKLVKGFKRMKDDRFKQIEDQLTAG